MRPYPKYTVVAEKFHAIRLLCMTNTRMKDYFDLLVLLGEGNRQVNGAHSAACICRLSLTNRGKTV
jgi:hypothetical protein